VKRILIIRLTALGDVLLATPLLRAIRRAFPEAQIDWLVDGGLVPLLTENPHLNRAIAATPGGRAKLFEQRYDLIIDLQNKLDTAWLRARLGARRTLVLRKRSFGRALLSLLGRDPPERGPSAVDRNLAIAARLGIPTQGRELDLPVSRIGATEAAPLLAQAGVPPIGLAPGGRWATKRWPHFVALARELAQRGHPLMLLGGPGDGAFLDELIVAAGDACAGDTRLLSVAGLASTIAACSAIVTNDSGPAHIAAAVGTPAVVLYGPTSPDRWAPPGRAIRVLSHDLSCSPCSNHGSAHCPLGTHACLRDLTVDEVLRAMPGPGGLA
jgi:lipopolysaccharide heptosyltransferase II